MAEKYITLEDGWGFRKTIPADKLPLAMQRYAEMREISQRAGNTPEETAKFTWRIVKDGE